VNYDLSLLTQNNNQQTTSKHLIRKCPDSTLSPVNIPD